MPFVPSAVKASCACTLPISAIFCTICVQMRPSSTVSNRWVTAWRMTMAFSCGMTRLVSSHSAEGSSISAHSTENAVGYMKMWQTKSRFGTISSRHVALPSTTCLLPERSNHAWIWYGSPSFIALNTAGMNAMSQSSRPLCSCTPRRLSILSLCRKRGVLGIWSRAGQGLKLCSMAPGFCTLPMRYSRLRAPSAHCCDCSYWSMGTPCMMPDWPVV